MKNAVTENARLDSPRKYTVLIVDDEEAFRRSEKRVIRRMRQADRGVSLDVLEAGSGEEAMHVLTEQQVDCVLLDYQMPGGNGDVWLARMLEEYPELAVIMVTGAGSEDTAAQTMRDGAMDYVVKGSMNATRMERAIFNALAKVKLQRTVEAQRQELVEAERQRAMMASLGAACHHMSQPMMVIAGYLHMMKDEESSPDMQALIDNCLAAMEKVEDVFRRLRLVSQFRTEPYAMAGMPKSPNGGRDPEILRI